MDVSPGTTLHIRILNYGSPTHITLRAEGGDFTNFTYENIFIEGEEEIHIPILDTAPEGEFSIQVITGYGMHREKFKIEVIKPTTESEKEENPREAKMKKDGKNLEKLDSSKYEWNIPLAFIPPIIGFIFLLLWLFVFSATAPIRPMAIILFVIMFIGFIGVWFSPDKMICIKYKF
ncbi:MAG TPA: hypothetical protein O0X32_00705 [Methanocorpusculum sp.]|nr:hypothetical protein [Methanocorpusculum sp.]